jgi:CIC family chloride channel protein
MALLSGVKQQFGQAIKPHVLVLCGYAILVGALAGVVAEAVLKMIYFFTHLFFSGHLSFKEVYPDHFHLGLWVILVPPVGGLVAGLIIHYWEPTVKGHGTPEAMQSVLIGHSVLRFRVGILKPFASALAIGTGGPFGAEGPIIQTGGVFGSVVAQLFHLPPYDRRVLLACGASAGLAATFLTPFAGVMIAIELLLFELAARSFIPVGVSTCTATVIAIYFRGTKPLFAATHPALRHMGELWLFALLGVIIGFISIADVWLMFWLEDRFDDFPLKPSAVWAPVVGALMMGAIGYFYPHIFGTSYDTITGMLNDRFTAGKVLEISIAKFWGFVISLASGTSGGVFAPSLVIGGGFGSAFASVWRGILPGYLCDPALYSLAAMGALFSGTSRVPLTSVVFMMELSRNSHAILPLIVTCFMADIVVRLFSQDSIMTGKLHKHGLLVFQDYSAPVLVGSSIGQVVTRRRPVPASLELDAAARQFAPDKDDVLAVVGPDGKLAGIIEAHDLLYQEEARPLTVGEVARRDYIMVEPHDRVNDVSKRMLARHVNNAAVVESPDGRNPLGVVRAADILRMQRRLAQRHLLTPMRSLQ